MPIIANNMVVGNKKVEEKQAPQPKPEVTPIIPLEHVSLVSKTKYDKDHSVLIVDGKPKTISKHSAYILDMLSIDQD